MIAENLYAHREDSKQERNFEFKIDDLYVNRTLAVVNSLIIAQNYQKLASIEGFPLIAVFVWISTVTIVTISLLRKRIVKKL